MELAHAHTHAAQTQASATRLHGFDAGAQSLPVTQVDTDELAARQVSVAKSLPRGHVVFGNALLRRLRLARCMSQQDAADNSWRLNIRLLLTTNKRAESGRAVRFRIAREFARCFELSLDRIALSGLG